MRIIADTSKCTGHGRCYDLAPDVFDADDDGYVKLLIDGDIPADKQNDARIAALNCPERALTVVE